MLLSQEFADLQHQINGMQPTETNIVEALHSLAEKAGRLAYAVEHHQKYLDKLQEKQAELSSR